MAASSVTSNHKAHSQHTRQLVISVKCREMDLKSCNSSVEEKAAKDKKPEGLKTRLSAGAIWFSSYFSVQNTSPSCSHANIKKINYLHQLLWIPRSLWAANGGVRRSSVEDPSRAQRGKICVLLILLKLV